MTPNEAVDVAKKYAEDFFSSEGATNFGLEELRFDEHNDIWFVTIGFTRRWEGPQGISRWQPNGEPWPRTYKIIEIEDSTGTVVSLKNWPVAA